MDQEILLAEWDEPNQENTLTSKLTSQAFGLALLVALALVILGWWQHDSTFYFAAAVAFMAATAYTSQQRSQAPGRHISLTSLRVTIGGKEVPMTDLGGFWLEHDREGLAVNLEHAKTTMIPTSLYFSNDNQEQATQLFLQVLPEVSPRTIGLNAKFGSLFRKK